MTTITEFNPTKAEAFAEGLLNILNSGAISLMISIGHRTGLFDTMAQLPPSTSQQIADAAGLQERYVREWLSAMVTSGFVDYNKRDLGVAEAHSDRTYYFPPEHATFLTRKATPNNMAVVSQFMAQLGSVEDRIVDCFYQGGGVPYSAYKRFHEIMAEDSEQTIVSALTDSVLPLVPGLIEALEEGIKVLDVGCGRGKALNRMATLFPNSNFKGYDFSPEAIANAQADASHLGLTNIQFEVKDAATFEEVEQYHFITTFDAVHDQARPDFVLKNIYHALRPDGVYLMQDIRAKSDVGDNLDHPVAPLLYTISCMHCMTVSLAVGGMGLGTMWGEETTLEMLEEAGFDSV